MNTVVTIHLAGRSYGLEEKGYLALKAYLEEAEAKLAGNPDKEEILKDFEIALGEKCERYLNSRKNVVSSEEVEAIIQEMGPVEGTSSASSAKTDGEKEESGSPKKLYRILDGRMIGGVCNGVAAYFNMDITLVRIIFAALAVLTHGAWILVYFIMMIAVPVANTPGQKAAAFGVPPITAQELLQKAKDGYSTFRNSTEWKRWKHQLREERKRWKHERRNFYKPSPFYELMHSILGMAWLAFFIYISWFGYNHVPAIHTLFDTIGNAIEQLIDKLADKWSQR